MRPAELRRRLGAVIGLVVLAVIGLSVGAYIIAHQNADLPSWIPLVGEHPFVVHAELASAQGVTPGQGQPVEIAGVVVGRVSSVRVQRGRGVLTLHIDRRYAKLYRNASALLRPRSLLKDMLVALSPGTPSAGVMRSGATIPISNTLPDVNFDEILSSLDADTRDALVSLAQGAGEGLGGQGDRLGALFRRLDPTTRYLRRINTALTGRRKELARSVHAFSQIADVLGRNSGALTRFVTSSDQVFGSLAAEQEGLRRSLAQLPATVAQIERTTQDASPVLASLRSASTRLLPGARALDPGLRALTPFFADTKSAVGDQLRPYARGVQPPLRQVRHATDGLPQTTSSSASAFKVLNRLLNELAYDPPGTTPSRLFWAGWSAHQFNSLVSAQDAQGPYLHSLDLTICESLHIIPNLILGDPPLALVVKFLNLPKEQDVCKSTIQ
jgi:phospholipid/cholesterol/gamma-HCH transport system substrate-binding protein